MDPSRRNTTGSGRKGKDREPTPPRRTTWGFKKEATSSSVSLTPKLKQETFPVYNLRWEALKAWLEQRFPGYSFDERRVGLSSSFKAFLKCYAWLENWHIFAQVNRDYYHFDVPENLTKVRTSVFVVPSVANQPCLRHIGGKERDNGVKGSDCSSTYISITGTSLSERGACIWWYEFLR